MIGLALNLPFSMQPGRAHNQTKAKLYYWRYKDVRRYGGKKIPPQENG